MTIFFTYDRPCSDLLISAPCARHHSPKSEVVEMIGPVSERSEAYRKTVQLIPTANSRMFEMECILRWIHLLDFMERRSLEEVFTCDVDVLLFQDMEIEEKGWFSQFDYTLGSNSAGLKHAGTSFFRLPVLREFVAFLFALREPVYHDMWLWTRFYESHPQFTCGEFTNIVDGATYDLSMGNQLGQYATNPDEPIHPMKQISFRDGRPYGRLLATGDWVRFKSLHCWAWSRPKMQEFFNAAKRSSKP